MNTTRRLAGCATIVVALAVAACASLDVDRMLPPIESASQHRFDVALRVLPVTGARQESFGGPALVSDAMYREALVRTLRQSNLFRQIETERPGDYELHTELFAQGQGAVALDYRSALIVQYRIVDARTGADLWNKGFNSRKEVTVTQALSGAKRTVSAQEGSVRDNLAQLVAALSSAELP